MLSGGARNTEVLDHAEDKLRRARRSHRRGSLAASQAQHVAIMAAASDVASTMRRSRSVAAMEGEAAAQAPLRRRRSGTFELDDGGSQRRPRSETLELE